ncbi:MAG: MFS transporter, partial [Candidatus Thorarchaeota archaeon]
MEPVVDQEDRSLVPFAVMWSGQAVSLLGTRIVRFALVWYITVLTGSATVLAIATIMAILPQVIVAPFAGSYVDRWNRKKTMIVADFLIACTIMALALMFSVGIAEIWHIFFIMLIGSTFGAFHWPAMQASTTMMVPRRHLSRVGGMNQALSGMANILAPPIGAVLYAMLPMQSILLVDVSSAAIAILAVAAIKIPQPKRRIAAEETSVLGDMKEGFAFLRGWRGGFVLVIVAMGLNLLTTPAFSLIPILVSKHFLGTENDLALLQAISAGGMVLGSILLMVWGGTERRINTAL